MRSRTAASSSITSTWVAPSSERVASAVGAGVSRAELAHLRRQPDRERAPAARLARPPRCRRPSSGRAAGRGRGRDRSRRSGAWSTRRPGRTPRRAAPSARRSSRSRCRGPRRRSSRPSAAGSRVTATVTTPRSVNLQAFERRLKSAWRSLVRSARMAPTSGAHWTSRRFAFFWASGSSTAATSRTSGSDVEGLEVELHLPRLDLREVEHGVDELEEVLAGRVDPLEVGDEALGVLVLGLLLEHLAVADDGVERRPELVGHVGEELRLVTARDLELPALRLELPEEPGVLDGQGGLGGEGLEEVHDLLRELPHGLAPHRQDAQDPLLRQERDRQDASGSRGRAGPSGSSSRRTLPRRRCPAAGPARGGAPPGPSRPPRDGSERRPAPRPAPPASDGSPGAGTPECPGRTRRSPRRRRPESCTARLTIVVRTVGRSSVELTVRLTALSACSSSTDRVSSPVRAWSSGQEPDVLDGDDGLVGEGLDQLDLLVREGLAPRDRAYRTMTPTDGASRSIGTAEDRAVARRHRRPAHPGTRDRPGCRGRGRPVPRGSPGPSPIARPAGSGWRSGTLDVLRRHAP